jgi:hypothetical protein
MAVEVNGVNPCRIGRAASIAAAVALILSLPHVSAGQLAPAREYEIKAGFVFNFAKFISWPKGAFESDTDDLRLEVIGHDPFDGALDRLVAGKMIDSHQVVIVYSSDVSSRRRGHIVFVSGSERKQLPNVIAVLGGAAALTVSDIDQFAEQGGVIGLVAAGQTVKFVINRAAAAKAGLKVAAVLLSLATVLDGTRSAAGPESAATLTLSAASLPLGRFMRQPFSER